MTTKHEQILQYIQSLPVGGRISVRGIARRLQVSEGTAYRAIKDAELQGYVSAIDRIGTVRIERKQKTNIENLTFAEVINIVGGTVLGGRNGLHKSLHKFVIGAMEMEAIEPYLEPSSLMIVGNRHQVQRASLEHGMGVLITGGFDAPEEIRAIADSRDLPLISCTSDTFSTASMINRAIYDRLIKKDILFVEDVVKDQKLSTLLRGQTVGDYRRIVADTGHSRLPVVDDEMHLIGVVTRRDVEDATESDAVEQHMSKNVVAVTLKTTIASAAHRMMWEGIEMLPVLHHRRLVGVLSRQDVIKALQMMSRQPQLGDTLQDIVVQGFEEVRHEDRTLVLSGTVTPQMTNAGGTLAIGSLATLMEHSALLCLQRIRNVDMAVENMTVYGVKPVSVDARIEVHARMLNFGRWFAKVDVEIYDAGELAAKALMTTQLLER